METLRSAQKILLIYRNANGGKPGTSMLGLGVNATHSINVLKRLGYLVEAVAVWTEEDYRKAVDEAKASLVVIEAPFLGVGVTTEVAVKYPYTKFLVRCHSNANFLSVEFQAIALLREIQLHSDMISNLSVSSNSESFSYFMSNVYDGRCVYLPNLYNMERESHRPRHNFRPGQTLKIGSWGATRLMKLHVGAATSALLLAHELGCPLEFFVNKSGGSGSEELLKAIANFFVNVKWATLTVVSWESWPHFRRTVKTTDLSIHLSCSETFNLTTADSLASMVPVVGSPAISWLPSDWKVRNPDDEREVVRVAKSILYDHGSHAKALDTITNVCNLNEQVWSNYLTRIGIRPI